MKERNSRWWAALGLALIAGFCMGVQLSPMRAVPAMAAVEENVFAKPAPGFSIEVIAPKETPEPKRVLIYHTHTYEAFAQLPDNPYPETETWRTADAEHNMVRVGRELAALLRAHGIEVVHDETAFEPPVLSSAYGRSLAMLQSRQAMGERYDLYIDLHRDAFIASYPGGNTVNLGGTEVAKLMMLIGKGEGATGQGFDEKPDWQSNLAIARRLTDCLQEQHADLCREVSVKSGRYNQHIAPCCILVEAGNNRNTLAQVLAAMPYLADAIVQELGQ